MQDKLRAYVEVVRADHFDTAICGHRGAPVTAPENSARMPLFQRLDTHVAYKLILPSWTLTLYGDLWIVPKSSAQLYPTYSYDWSEQGWVIGPTLLPVLGANARF